MIITIQKSTRGYVVTMIDKTEFVDAKLQEMTCMSGEFSDEYFKKYGIRPTIKILPIIHTPMATKTPPAKKAKALKKLAKKKKVVKKKK